MSWYIQQLLSHSEEIRASIIPDEEDSVSFFDPTAGLVDFVIVPDFDNDVYNDLLILEREIKRLYSEKILRLDDVQFLSYFSCNPRLSDLETKLNSSREMIGRKFTLLCNIIEMHVSEPFTDKGYLKQLKEVHKLSDEQLNIISEYMKSNFKNKILKRRYNEK